jgi:hypothetical protein
MGNAPLADELDDGDFCRSRANQLLILLLLAAVVVVVVVVVVDGPFGKTESRPVYAISSLKNSSTGRKNRWSRGFRVERKRTGLSRAEALQGGGWRQRQASAVPFTLRARVSKANFTITYIHSIRQQTHPTTIRDSFLVGYLSIYVRDVHSWNGTTQ